MRLTFNGIGTAVFVLLCWLPSLAPAANSWRLRLICVLLLLPLFVAFIFVYIWNLTDSSIKEKPEPEYYKVVKKACLNLFKVAEENRNLETNRYFDLARKVCRVGTVVTTFCFVLIIIFPFELAGSKAIRGAELTVVLANVSENNVTFGAWFLAQSLNIDQQGQRRELYYFLPSDLIQSGRNYRFGVLPGYPVILDSTLQR